MKRSTDPLGLKMMCAKSACRLLQASEAKVLHLINTGSLAAYSLDGKIMFRESDILALLALHGPRNQASATNAGPTN